MTPKRPEAAGQAFRAILSACDPFGTLTLRQKMAKYPDDADGDALRRIAEHGSNMDEPMKIEFSIDVPSELAGIAVAERATTLGYEPDLFHDDESDRWSVYCGKQMLANYENVVSSQLELNKIAAEHDSHCDGWLTRGNRDHE
jgi:hypothetical protein